MNKLTRVLLLLLMLMVLVSGTSYYLAAPSKAPVMILFTHDLHDNLLPFTVEKSGSIEDYGGFARLQTAIQQQREKDSELVLVDGGDFSMGTLFQTIFSQEAPGLRLLGQMGYDVVTLGNHEFDFRPDGLARSLHAAQASKDRLPLIVAGNVSFPTNQEGGIVEPDLKKLQNAMNEYGVRPYTILERKGYRIGIFGLMGKDADSNAPMAGVKFTDQIEEANRIVDQLENKEKVDLIICLSHSGTESDRDKSEDVILAQKVPEIDVIISGHSHSKLEQPIVEGNTYICSGGEYGQSLGIITIEQETPGVWNKLAYQLTPIDDHIPADPSTDQRIQQFKTIVQQSYLDSLNMKFDDTLAYSPFSFASISQIIDQHAEAPLGNLISDAYRYAVKEAEGAGYEQVDVTVVPVGTIRASFVKGNITVSDAFNASSLGIGPDKKSGYPLISIYLTGKELKTACEVDASIAPLMKAAQLYMSGISYTFNPNRMMFNKVTEVAMQNSDGSRVEIDDARLYRVVAGLYSAQMLSVVGEKSFGLLSIVPKTKEGTPITDYEAQIIKDTASGNNNELKEWAAIAKYLQSFDSVKGVPQVPTYYSQSQGRKIIDDRTTPGAILSHPNHIALMAYGFVLLIILLIILAIRFMIKRRQRASNSVDHTPRM